MTFVPHNSAGQLLLDLPGRWPLHGRGARSGTPCRRVVPAPPWIPTRCKPGGRGFRGGGPKICGDTAEDDDGAVIEQQHHAVWLVTRAFRLLHQPAGTTDVPWTALRAELALVPARYGLWLPRMRPGAVVSWAAGTGTPGVPVAGARVPVALTCPVTRLPHGDGRGQTGEQQCRGAAASGASEPGASVSGLPPVVGGGEARR